jgi:hypothetical protein
MLPVLLVWLLGGMTGWAQPIMSDAHWPYPRERQPRPLLTRDDGFDTLPFSATQPFFDDFSTARTEPDGQRWFTDSSAFDLPRKTFQMAVDPPSYGVVTFDGQQRNGRPYATNAIVSGVADRLLSQRLDLSGLSPADSVILTFYLQPQGRGDIPEATDSFYVYVRTSLPDEEFRLIFATGGRPVRDFDQVILPLEDSAFFHAGFQLRFESIGGLSGALDHWHLDYVYLAPNLQRNNLRFNDRSITQVLRSPLDPYTAIPAQHYLPGQRYMDDFSLNLSNLTTQPQQVGVTARIDDPVGSNPFLGGALSGGSASVPPYAQGAAPVNISRFDDQPLNFSIATYQLTAALAGSDDYPENDTLRRRFGIDSLLAYDDGEADAIFGLNKPWSFGMQVELDRPDSVTAVWICFVPSVYFNPLAGTTTYLEDQPFRILFWDDPDPDSIFSQQAGGARVRYGTAPNHFERYAFPAPVAVPATFWVGVQQVNSIPIGVGLDRTFDRDDLTYYDASGDWINTNVGGALMIRPEFYRTAEVPVSSPAATGPTLVQAPQVYPQPARAGQALSLRWPPSSNPQGLYQAELRDLSGRVVWRLSLPLDGPQRIVLPTTLAAGCYLWRHQWHDQAQQPHEAHQRLLLLE